MEEEVADRPHPCPIGHVQLVLVLDFCRRVWRNVGDNTTTIRLCTNGL
jgi:hypothetical protein